MYIFIYIYYNRSYFGLDLGKKLSRIFRDNTEEADFGENFSVNQGRSSCPFSTFLAVFTLSRKKNASIIYNPLYKYIIEKRIKIRTPTLHTTRGV